MRDGEGDEARRALGGGKAGLVRRRGRRAGRNRTLRQRAGRSRGCVLHYCILYCIRSLGTDSIEFDYSLFLLRRSVPNRCTSVPSPVPEIDFPPSLCAHNRSPKLVIFGPQLRFVFLRIRLTARSSL